MIIDAFQRLQFDEQTLSAEKHSIKAFLANLILSF